MHFIERIFGMAPDGGNGLFELALLLASAFALAMPFLRKIARALARLVSL